MVIVLGVVGYFGYKYYQDLSKPTPTVTTSTTNPATTTDETANWKTYANTKYGFQLTFTDAWKGYQVKEETPNDAAVNWLRFYVPTTDTSWSGSLSGYADPFVISVYTPTEWDKVQSEGGATPTYINKNSQYVFGYSMWQACPKDLCDVITSSAIKNIISTFKFTN